MSDTVYQPRGPGADVDHAVCQTGELARAAAVNAILVPLSYLSCYVMQVALRCSETPCDGTALAPAGTPILPTHGVLIEDPESTLFQIRLPRSAQFGRVAVVMRPVLVGGPTDITVTDGVSSRSRRFQPLQTSGGDDSATVLRPVPLTQRYPELGPCGISSRDLAQEWTATSDAVIVAPASDSVDVEALDSASLMHIPWISVYGVGNTRAAATAALDFDEWPDASPFADLYGSPGYPRLSLLVPGALRDLAALDRSVHARGGAVLASSRSHGPEGYATVAGNAWVILTRGLFHTLPTDRLPGSDNVTGASSGSTIGDRGAIRCVASITDLELAVGVRKITPGGSYGEGSTVGAWAWTHATGPSPAFSTVTVDALLPVGIEPGDMYEVCVAIRSSVATDRCEWYVLSEPPLQTVNP